MTQLYCGDCRNYLMGSDGQCHDCSCGWNQPVETYEKENTELETEAARLQKENEQWKTTLDCNEQIRVAQAKRIEELEAATEHLGLTPKQAADGLARHKAQLAEIESLRKQVEMLLGSTRKTVLALAHASIHDPLYTAAYDELSESIKLASKNG